MWQHLLLLLLTWSSALVITALSELTFELNDIRKIFFTNVISFLRDTKWMLRCYNVTRQFQERKWCVFSSRKISHICHSTLILWKHCKLRVYLKRFQSWMTNMRYFSRWENMSFPFLELPCHIVTAEHSFCVSQKGNDVCKKYLTDVIQLWKHCNFDSHNHIVSLCIQPLPAMHLALDVCALEGWSTMTPLEIFVMQQPRTKISFCSNL
jgi:hypothetical protein